MGPETLQRIRDHREVVVGSKPLDLPGGSVRGRRHRQAAASGRNEHIPATSRCYHDNVCSSLLCEHIEQNLKFVFNLFRKPNVSRTLTSRGRGSCSELMRSPTWCSAAWETRRSARCCPRASEQHNTHDTLPRWLDQRLCLYLDGGLSGLILDSSSTSCSLTSWSSWSSVRSLCPVTWRRNGWCFLVSSLCPTPPCWRFWARPLTRTPYR